MNYLSESQHQHTHTYIHTHTHTRTHGSTFSAGTAAEIGSGTWDMGHGTLLCIALPGKHLKNFCRTRVFGADSKTTADAAAEPEAAAAAVEGTAGAAEAEQPHNRTN